MCYMRVFFCVACVPFDVMHVSLLLRCMHFVFFASHAPSVALYARCLSRCIRCSCDVACVFSVMLHVFFLCVACVFPVMLHAIATQDSIVMQDSIARRTQTECETLVRGSRWIRARPYVRVHACACPVRMRAYACVLRVWAFWSCARMRVF